MSRSSCGGVITLIEASAPSFLTIALQGGRLSNGASSSEVSALQAEAQMGQLQAYRRIIHKNRRRAAVMRAE